MHRIIELIKSDSVRYEILELVSTLGLPDCYVGAGFVRNMVWDHLHNYSGTELNDVDVVYYSKDEIDEVRPLKQLNSILPKYNWQVKNQAIMHLRNEDAPYLNTVHAMEYWPEIETAVAARVAENSQIEVVAPFGVQSLFSGYITRNPKRSSHVFNERLKSKNWLINWPQLRVRL